MAAVGRFAGSLLLLVVAALWLSVLTWSVADPSLTNATSESTRNLMGPLGAIVSDLFLQTLGTATLVILIVPLFWGLVMVREADASQASAGPLTKLQFVLFPIAALLMAGAVSALPATANWPLNHGLGGIVGDTVFGVTERTFGIVNASRGGFAAGLVLMLAGLLALGRAVGVSLSQMVAAFGRSHAPLGGKTELANESFGEREHPFDDDSGRIEPRFMAGPLASASSEMDLNAPFANRQDEAASGFSPLRTHVARAVTTARDVAQRGVAAANHHAARLGSSLTQAAAWRGPGLDDSWRASHEQGQPFHGDMAATTGDAQYFAEHEYDSAEDEESRAIARRFAPPGAVPQSSHQPRKRLAARRQQPAPRHMFVDAPVMAGPQPEQHGAQQAAQLRGDDDTAHRPRVESPQNNAAFVETQQQDEAQDQARAPKAIKRNAIFGGLSFRHQGQNGPKRPSLNLLKKAEANSSGPELTQTVLRGNARLLEDVLGDFGVKGEVRDIRPGPVVTLYEFEPARGVKSSRVIGLAEDIARSMSAASARVAVVPGRNAIGIELPNAQRDPVLLRDVLDSKAYKTSDSAALPIALGKAIGGEPIVADLARMPHLLVAGTTGSGKSVGVNAMIVSLLYRVNPEECRFLMIDPKMLELSVYNGIPHLLAPVVTDPQKAVWALNWVVGEMEERYKRMSKLSVRNIDVFNNRVRNAKKRGEMISRTVQTGFDRRTGEAVYEQEQIELETMPYIVVVIDEFADLMMVAGKEVEASVQRLAQMARAAGIHIIMATQRPSVDVITGTIKANFPTRISFKVASKIDSRTILNEQGAEPLLGQGDMLFAGGSGQVARVHGAFVADDEVEAITDFLRAQGAPNYIEGITEAQVEVKEDQDVARGQSEEDLFDRAVAIVVRDRKASTSYLQRRLSIGYNRAADLIERMEAEGLISAANHTGKREILSAADQRKNPDTDAHAA